MEEGLFSLHTISKDMLQGISISVEPSAQLTTCIPDQAQNLHSCTRKLRLARPSGKLGRFPGNLKFTGYSGRKCLAAWLA